MKKGILIILLIIVLFSLSFVNAVEPVNETNISVEYDLEILEAFDNQTKAGVKVELNDNSNITITGTKEERKELLKQKDKWFEPVTDEVLAELSEDEFILQRESLRGFSGEITKEGFDKLINDTRVKAIYLDKVVYGVDSENESNYTACYDSEILEAFETQTEVRVIVRLADNSNITITGTKEEKIELMIQRDEWFMSETEKFLSTLSKDKFNVLSNISDGFVGMITKEGFDILINNTKVSEIYLDIIGNVALDENDITENITTPKSIPPIEKESESKLTKIEEKSWFSKLIQFFRSLFRLKQIKKENDMGLANPAAIHCHNLGYKYQGSSCIFPDNTSCDQWRFYAGLCGQEWSYCKRQGYDIIVKNDSKDPYSPYAYSVCVDKKTKKEIGSVVNLMHLEERDSKE